jgi:hypothetical protein
LTVAGRKIIFLQFDRNQRIKILKFARTPFTFSPSTSDDTDNFSAIPTIDATMQDNNNSTSLTNGDTHTSAADRYANIRAAEERKLLARNHANNSKKSMMMDQLTTIPIQEEENEDIEKNSGRESGGTASTPVDADNTDSVLLSNKNCDRKPSHSRRYLELVCERYEISKKSRLPFLILSVLCAVLLIAVIILAIVWPYIPSYMRSDVCVEQECFDASKQVRITFGISWLSRGFLLE